MRVRKTRARGVVAYVGPLAGKDGIFYGVELQSAQGKNDGSCEGQRYFRCPANRGVFVREANLEGIGAARGHDLYANDDFGVDDEDCRHMEGKKAIEGKLSSQSLERRPNVDLTGGAYRAASDPSQINTQTWTRGPIRPEGIAMNVSDRPVLCAAISPDGTECVVGGTDHGLKVFNMDTGKMVRNLYGRNAGHAEWVTDVSYCPDGTILSAGMDAKLCLWRGPRCDDLLGHRGSISRSLVAANGCFALSCGYDKTLRLWNLQSRQEVAMVKAHTAPILDMALSKSGLVMTGARDGTASVWDFQSSSKPRATFHENSHSGHVTSLHTWEMQNFATGDQAGYVYLHDLRAQHSNNSATSSVALHPGGAVNAIKTSASGTLLVSAGADKRVSVSDVRMLDQPVWTSENQHTDFIYSLHVAGDLVLSGSGNGTLLVHNIETGKLYYGLGANQAAIRTIDTFNNKMLVAGDDGNAISYSFR